MNEVNPATFVSEIGTLSEAGEKAVSIANQMICEFNSACDYITDEELFNVLAQDYEKLQQECRNAANHMAIADSIIASARPYIEIPLASESQAEQRSEEPKMYRFTADVKNNSFAFFVPYPSRVHHKKFHNITPYIPLFKQKIVKDISDNSICFKGKTILMHFVHVYQVQNAKRQRDNDNYEYNEIIDIVTDACCCGDRGQSCELFFETVITDRIIDEGTYVIVSPIEAPILAGEAVLEEIKKSYFPNFLA